MLQYARIGVTVKSGLDHKNEAVERVVAILRSLGATVLFDPLRINDVPCAKELPSYSADESDIDLLLVIGGDGTILRAVRELQNFTVPILSVNRGRIGFLAEITVDEAEDLLPRLLNGEGVLDERHLLHVTVERKDGTAGYDGFALNEVVIAQGMIARLMNLQTTVNGEPLTTYRSDGLIIATPTGSTAYSLAAGGPVVHPSLSATILTPLNPHSFTQKPVVIPGQSVVQAQVEIHSTKFDDREVFLTIDGQTSMPLKSGDRVSARMDGHSIHFLRRKEDTFYGTLREKLKWGENIDAD
jgi:NAD+ kinase